MITSRETGLGMGGGIRGGGARAQAMGGLECDWQWVTSL